MRILPTFVLTAVLGAAAPAAPPPDYLGVVRRAADAILQNGRDTYGTEHSGIILSVLDPATAKPLTALPKAPHGVREGDRAVAGGSNSNLQQDLYRAFRHLTRLTGDPRYDRAARESVLDTLRITQHPTTGFLAWGEHLSWDCVGDKLGNRFPPPIHEPKRKFLDFDLCYEADPDRTLKYARGLWDHQISNQQTGDFSRHAGYDRHKPGKGYDFPKEGSYFIDTWTRAYEKTRDPVYAQAAAVLAGRYLGRTTDRGLLDFESAGVLERLNMCVTLWLISMAIECHDAAPRVDGGTAALLRKLAAAHDKGFLSLAHAPDDRERGFVCYAFTDTGKPRPRAEKKSQGYSQHWGMGYGINTTSMFGLLSYTRQAQLGTGPVADAYRREVVRAADLYRSVFPDPAAEDVWAGEYGMAVAVEVAAYRLTKNPAYLDAARRVADLAVAALWDGSNPLPRASTKSSYYDVVAYPDTLLLSLLALHEHVAGLDPRVEVSDLNR